jgi:hypothetical protein
MQKMNALMRKLAHSLVFVLGLGLIVGGIVTGKHGAVVIGLIVAAVNFQQWLKWNKQRSPSEKKKPEA